MASSSEVSVSGSFGAEGWRCQGIRTWADVETLGSRNLRALREFAEEVANRALADGDRDALVELRLLLERLTAISAKPTEEKPLLPRLRRESFRRGESVRLYLGELRNAPETWLPANVVSIEKAYNVDWKSFEPNSGYYWRITARLEQLVPGLPQDLSFSTSEPRVLPENELVWLREGLRTDPGFVEIFVDNARREWQPLWCQERGIIVDTAGMDPKQWLTAPF